MTASLVLVLAFLIGALAGLRSLTAPAVVAFAAHQGWMNLRNTALSFMGSTAALAIFALLALGELVADKLPSTPSRKAPVGFTSRILTGGLSGAAVGASVFGGAWIPGLGAGIVGAVVGTLGGYQFRMSLTKAIGNATAAALLEDVIAIVGGYFIVR